MSSRHRSGVHIALYSEAQAETSHTSTLIASRLRTSASHLSAGNTAAPGDPDGGTNTPRGHKAFASGTKTPQGFNAAP